jgi:hypothetical protein
VFGHAEDFKEAGQVVGFGDLVFVFDADEESEGRISAEFFEASVHGVVAEEDGQEEDAPKNGDGAVIATFAAMLVEGIEEFGVGNCFQGGFDDLKGGGIFDAVPGEKGFGVGNNHVDLALVRV